MRPEARSIQTAPAALGLALAFVACGGCARRTETTPPSAPPETFTWVAQPIAFSPPPPRWYREAENSGGLLGVRFVLTGGEGECITVAAYRLLVEEAKRSTGADLTLASVLPQIRLRPDLKQEPFRWRIAYERDTTLAGRPAFASDDTLITPEQPLLYRQVFWVVNGCPFQATYQGTPRNLGAFRRVLASIAFPESARAGSP